MSIHKLGDLVECTWQPSVSHYDNNKGAMISMKYVIKDEIGIIVGVVKVLETSLRYDVLFSRYKYFHTLADNTFINHSAINRNITQRKSF